MIQYQRTVLDLEAKLLERDKEVVHLRSDVQHLRHEVLIKEGMITKLQDQMERETIEHMTEITSLKEILTIEGGGRHDVKRRQIDNGAQVDQKFYYIFESFQKKFQVRCVLYSHLHLIA